MILLTGMKFCFQIHPISSERLNNPSRAMLLYAGSNASRLYEISGSGSWPLNPHQVRWGRSSCSGGWGWLNAWSCEVWEGEREYWVSRMSYLQVKRCKLLDGRGCKVCEMMMCVNCCAQDVVGIPIRSSILVLKLSWSSLLLELLIKLQVWKINHKLDW